MPNILFATNRTPTLGPDGKPTGFGDAALDPTPGNLYCGTAVVEGIDAKDADSGKLDGLLNLNLGAFAPEAIAPVLASQNDVLVFVHGTDNSFHDAVVRAAYNREWISQGGPVIDLILFTWPARSYGNYINLIADHADYTEDQRQAGLTQYAFHLFLGQLRLLQPHLGKRRLHLLCHSMGNYMLADAVDQLFAADAQPALPRFENVILAAADEDFSSLHFPGGGRLSNLWRLGHEVTVYFSREDALMVLSRSVNGVLRLGYNGPPDKPDLNVFPTRVYEFVDCTGVNDSLSNAPLSSHQYYRESPTVRTDIVATLAGKVPQRLKYDAAANVYSLFPPPALLASAGPGDRGTGVGS
jgi:esterase/lipase superfamily enzyme